MLSGFSVPAVSPMYIYIICLASRQSVEKRSTSWYSALCAIFNSLSAQKQTTKFTSANILIFVLSSCIIVRIQRLDDKQYRY